MEEKSLKPRIRFKGFTEVWEQRKFEDVAVIRRGLTYSPSDIRNTGIRVLRSSNIDEEYFVKFEDDVFVDKNCINIPFVNNGDILITSANGSSRLVGKHAIIHDLRHNSAVHGGFMLLASSKNPYFVNASMSSAWYKKFIDLYVAGGNGAIGNLKKNDLDNYELMIPTNNEQIKIGELFKKLDAIITLHQRKFEKLSQIKKSLLEKMFPTEGSTTPKIRFKGFTEAWEQRKCSDISNRYDNLRVPVAEAKRIPGSTPYYGANGVQDYVDGYTHNGEFVLVAEDGANDLKNYPVQYVNGQIWVNNHAHVLQSNETNSTMFLKYLINSADIESVLVGGGRAKLNANVLMDLEFTVPKKNEQTKISTLLGSVDNLITLHQRKYEKLKNIKKSLLEKMFV